MARVNWSGYDNEMELYQAGAEPQQAQQDVAFRRSFADTGGSLLPLKEMRSANYRQSSAGWVLTKSGELEANGNRIVSTHFTPIFSGQGKTVYVSNGTTPNGNLSGTAGDICLNGPSGQPFYCGGGTTWTGM